MSERVLVVEDDTERIAWFRERYAGADVTDDPDEAARWMSAREYALIFLDHDLAPHTYAGYNEADTGTGRDVARWIAENGTAQRDARIVVHSMNYPGAMRMIQVLHRGGRNAAYMPFSVLKVARDAR